MKEHDITRQKTECSNFFFFFFPVRRIAPGVDFGNSGLYVITVGFSRPVKSLSLDTDNAKSINGFSAS